MEQITYERPREKIQHRGVKFLTLPELIQVVIGSGTAQVSGARLARRVSRSLEEGPVSYAQLITMNGVGRAKASQLLAAIELGRRMHMKGSDVARHLEVKELYLAQARSHGANAVTCYWFDGSRALLDYKLYRPHPTEHYSLLVKRILVDALAVSAHSVLVFYPSKNAQLRPSTYEMGFVRQLYDTARYFQIGIEEVCGINRKEWVRWKKEVV